MVDLGKYGNCKTDEERQLVDEYMGRTDPSGELLQQVVIVFHEMRMTLEERSAKRTAKGQSLVKYNPFSGQGRVLAVLAEEDGVPQISLAHKLNVKAQTLSTAIKKLEAKELIERNSDPLDARVQLVSLTDKGRSLVQSFKNVEKYSGSMFEALNEEELQQALTIFGKLQAHLEAEMAADSAVDSLLR